MDTMVGTERPRAFDPSQAAPGMIPPRPGWDVTEKHSVDGRGLAHTLGWLSIGLGMTQLLAAEQVGEALGMEDRTELIRAFGVREVVSGMGILSQERPATWMAARVAGDALDLATLLTRIGPDNPRRGTVAALVAAVAGITVLDVIAGSRLARK